MHLLVTRPETDALTLQRRLEAMGHRVSLAPLLTIVPETPPLDLESVQALIATSRNAVRSLAAHPERNRFAGLPLITVGRGTGSTARAEGFNVIAEGTSGGAELADLLTRIMDPAKGALLHVSGDVIAFDLAATLAPRGFTIRRAVVYRSLAAGSLPTSVNDALRSRTLDAVLLMSPRSSEVWVDLVRAAGLVAETQGVFHLCLSDAVAEPVRKVPGARLRVAVQPNTEEMLALAGQLSSSSPR